MKKFTRLLIMTLAVIATMTGCQDEEVLNTSDKEVAVSIGVQPESVVQARNTEGQPTWAIPEGYKLRYILEAWTDGTFYLRETLTEASADAVKFELKLLAGHQFELLFWADFVPVDAENEDNEKADFLYATNGDDETKGLHEVTRNTTDDFYSRNDGIKRKDDGTIKYEEADLRDAFCKSLTINTGNTSELNQNVKLTRAMSQLNIYTYKEDYEVVPEGHRPNYTTVSINAPQSFNVSTGQGFGERVAWKANVQVNSTSEKKKIIYQKASGENQEVSEKKDVYKLFTSYYFTIPNGDESKDVVDFTAKFYKDATQKAEVELNNIPLRKNYRTNIYGSGLLTSDATFTVTCDPDFEDEYDLPGQTFYVSTDADVSAALASVTATDRWVSLIAAPSLDTWTIPSTFAPTCNDFQLNIKYDGVPSSITITEASGPSSASTSTTTARGNINVYIPTSADATVTISTVTLNTPNWGIGINEGKTDALNITTLSVTAGTNVVMGSNVTCSQDPVFNPETTTYTVYTAVGLLKARDEVAENLTYSITLAADIDLTNVEKDESGSNWAQIGKYPIKPETEYTGTFNGQGHSITGLTIVDATDNSKGLIGQLGERGIVTDVVLIDCHITSTQKYVGGIVGYNEKGTVSRCVLKGNSVISSSYVTVNNQPACVGGIVGYNNGGTIDNCSVENSTIGSDIADNIGGIAGYNAAGKINDCFVKDGAFIIGADKVGGITGRSHDTGSSVEDSGIIGDNITVIGATNVGGVVGYMSSSSVSKCSVDGTVFIKATSSNVGGIVGNNHKTASEITDCSVNENQTGSIIITSDGKFVGGIAGANQGECHISNCHIYQCSLIGNEEAVGGIVGVNHGYVSGCVAENNSVEGLWGVGGIAGQNTRFITACYTHDATLTITETDDVEKKKAIGSISGTNSNSDNYNRGYITGCYAYMCLDNVVGTNYKPNNTQAGIIAACYFNTSGETVTSVNADKVKELLTGEHIKSGVSWEDAVSAMNTAIGDWNKTDNATGKECKYQWAKTVTVNGSAIPTTYETAALEEIPASGSN